MGRRYKQLRSLPREVCPAGKVTRLLADRRELWSTSAMVSRYAHVVAPIRSDVAARLDKLLGSSGQDGSGADQLPLDTK